MNHGLVSTVNDTTQVSMIITQWRSGAEEATSAKYDDFIDDIKLPYGVSGADSSGQSAGTRTQIRIWAQEFSGSSGWQLTEIKLVDI